MEVVATEGAEEVTVGEVVATEAVLEVVATVRADQGVPAAPLTDRKKSAMV